MWVYIKNRDGTYSVGFYEPLNALRGHGGIWHGDRDYSDIDAACERVNYLNGGAGGPPPEEPVAEESVATAAPS